MQEKCNFSCSRPCPPVLHHTTALAIPCTQKGYNLPRFVMGALFPTVRSSPGVSLLGTGGEPRRVARVLATVRIVVLLAAAYRWGMIKTAHRRSIHRRVVGGGGLGRGMRKGGTTCKHSPKKTAIVGWGLLANEAVIPALRGDATPKLPRPWCWPSHARPNERGTF